VLIVKEQTMTTNGACNPEPARADEGCSERVPGNPSKHEGELVSLFSYLGRKHGRPPVLFNRIPQELKERPQWVLWRFEERKGEETKPPLDPVTGEYAKVNDPSTWGTFEQAVDGYEYYVGECDGIGFVFCEEDPFTGIDFDNCRNAETGEINPQTARAIGDLDSYTEASPSGDGVHTIVEAVLPVAGKKKKDVELYSSGRFFTFTGNHLAGTPDTIAERQSRVDRLYSYHFEKKTEGRIEASPEPVPTSAALGEVIARASRGPSGEKFEKLMAGDWSGYPSRSEADLALCSILSYYCNGDPQVIDAAVRRSGLYRSKWDEKHGEITYGEMTIEKAVAGTARPEEKAAALAESFVNKALESDKPTAVILAPDAVKALAVLKKKDAAGFAIQKSRLQGKVNLNDLNAAVKEASVSLQPRAVKHELPSLMETETGYSVERETRGGPVTEVLSNFKLYLSERLVMPGGKEILAGQIEIYGAGASNSRTFVLPNDALITKNRLLEDLGTVDVVWLGTDRDVQLLRAHLLTQEAPRLQGTAMAGRHGGVIVMPGIVISRDGPVVAPPCRWVNPDGDGWIYRNRLTWPETYEHRNACESIYRLFPLVNEANITVPIIALIFATPWAALIRSSGEFGGFPHLCMWGQTGSGKSAYEELILKLFGVRPPVKPLSLPGTRFTRLKNYSSSNLVPVVYDEYRIAKFTGNSLSIFHSELLGAYGGERDRRGRADQTVTAYDLAAPVVLAGEDRPRDSALEHRMVVLNPSDGAIRNNPTFQGSFRTLMSAPLDAFPYPYWAWALGQEDWLDVLKEELGGMRNLATDSGIEVPIRIEKNLAIVRFGWRMFNRYGEHMGLKPADLAGGTVDDAISAALDQVLPGGKPVSTLDDLISFFAVMVSNGKLEYGEQYIVKSDGLLVFRIREAHAEGKKYARETNKEGNMLGFDHYWTLVKALAEQPGSYVIEASVLADFNPGAGSKRRQLHGVLIDPEILQVQLGIDCDIWEQRG
jgi:putative DNA primase/helicase